MDKGSKILVIDDEEDLRENLKYVFQKKGYVVELAEDGIKGLKVLENFSPDLIILDLNMPHMGGIEFYQKICVRDLPIYPVFVLTARANMEKFFKDFNVDGFMSKPFELEDLIHEIGFILNKKTTKVCVTPSDPKKIFIVEGNEEYSRKIGEALLNRGFIVNLASSGSEAIERISKDVPGVVCVNMNLSDIPGEIVIQKLKRMAKTSGIRSILYVLTLGENSEIINRIKEKEGIDKFIELDSEKSLVDAIDELLREN